MPPPSIVACLFPSSLLRVGDRFVHQQSPLLSVPRQPWTLCHCSVWPVLDVICPSSPWPASSSLSIESSFQYFGAQVSSSDHIGDCITVQLLAGVPVVVLLLALMHWSYVPFSLPSAIVDILSSQKPCIRLLSTAFGVHVSATVHTNADRSRCLTLMSKDLVLLADA